jgi:hypothetical protein
MKPTSLFIASPRSLLLLGALLLVSGSKLYADDNFVWATKASCPLVRFEAVGGAAAGKLFQFSGFYTLKPKILITAECDAYDPVTDRWSSIASVPEGISHCGQVADTDDPNRPIFWLAGGYLGDHPGPSTDHVWKYDIRNNTWSAGPPLPAVRGAGVLVKVGRELHYYGGAVRVNGVVQSDYGTHWALDLDGGTAWRTTTTTGQLLAPMPNPRNHVGGTQLNGKLYAIGGQHLEQQNTTNQTEVDVYDPGTNTWTQTTPLPMPTGHITANVFVSNGRIVVVAGRGQGGTPLANVLEYDPSTGAWAQLPALPSGRQSPVSGLVGSQMVVTCGLNKALSNQTWVSQTSQSSGQSVISFTLINADTDQPVPGYEVMSGGAVINTTSIGTTNLNIRANTNPSVVGSVRFSLDGNSNAQTETNAPYALFGDNGRGNYNAGTFANGQHTVSAVPYTGSSGQGTAGTALTISFTIQSTNSSGPWQTGPRLPLQTSEVSCGVINGVLYLVGGGNGSSLSNTLSYNLSTGVWRSDSATRPYVGDHHGAEVINGKFYLFGGINVFGPKVAAGKVQIYNPATNSWSLGASMPWACGSVNTAYINGKVYAAGGIVGNVTVNTAAVYDPAANTWTPIASMPIGRNHAAAGTDGQKFYIFGGRTGPNATTVGFDDVQIYDPASNTWQWSGQAGSNIPLLPQKRGGMGKAAFYNGEFYVMGGETTNSGTGQTANNVYNRVDVYNPVARTWRLEAPMPTARHGIFPVVGNGKILVAGGGDHASISASDVFEIFAR